MPDNYSDAGILSPDGSPNAADYIAELQGGAPLYLEYVLDYEDLNTTAGLTKTLSGSKDLPQDSIVLASTYKVTTAFVGTGITSLLLDIGDNGGDLDGFHNDIDLLVGSGGDWKANQFGVYLSSTPPDPRPTPADWTLDFGVTAVGANLDQLTAGAITYRLYYVTARKAHQTAKMTLS